MCGCPSYVPYWGHGLQLRHVPWLGIEPMTHCFAAPTLNPLSHTSQGISRFLKLPLVNGIISMWTKIQVISFFFSGTNCYAQCLLMSWHHTCSHYSYMRLSFYGQSVMHTVYKERLEQAYPGSTLLGGLGACTWAHMQACVFGKELTPMRMQITEFCVCIWRMRCMCKRMCKTVCRGSTIIFQKIRVFEKYHRNCKLGCMSNVYVGLCFYWQKINNKVKFDTWN